MVRKLSKEEKQYIKLNSNASNGEIARGIRMLSEYAFTHVQAYKLVKAEKIAAVKRDKAREKNRQKANEDLLTYRATTLYKGALDRTKLKNARTGKEHPFDITIEWVREKLEAGVCESSGQELYIKDYKFKESQTDYERIHPRSASLDQINPGKGYTKDNVRVICDMLNKMFSDKSDDEAYPVVKAWIEHYEKSFVSNSTVHNGFEVSYSYNVV